MQASTVQVRRESVILPTYMPMAPEKNPMFLEKRVYQGSSGCVYPLPFTDRIAEAKTDVEWDAIHLENEFLYVMILPQIGGRIQVLRDKTNGYDLVYNQSVIKPALIGLTGPWISGGIEFNWPQHHRPLTFTNMEVAIEKHADGSVTVWLSEHDPLTRMKGMHGICLHPDRAVLEVMVRAYNRTPFVQTFLWWANVATRVHEHYQAFFPPDVHAIADHAKRATSEFPLCQGSYYGVDYKARAGQGRVDEEIPPRYVPDPTICAPNDLSWYANIPVPTSYMCLGSKEDFFGGYDYKEAAGLVHIADHHISPGKKLWTWGNHEFGYAWDRNLTDANAHGEYAPYIELMAGVYTDNQPDFSFLQPDETKCWSQYWYPIREIGAVKHANLLAAVNLTINKARVYMGVSVTQEFQKAKIVLEYGDEQKMHWSTTLSPATPFVQEVALQTNVKETKLRLRVMDCKGQEIIAYAPASHIQGPPANPATEPALPVAIASTDELFLTGLHLHQYRHATRSPIPYWQEALRRDPGDARCNNAMGLWHLKRGEFLKAETYFRRAISRLTKRNPNPADGEPFYHLGLCLRFLGNDEEATEIFAKATWNESWKSAAFHALAELASVRKDWATALHYVNSALRANGENMRARNLKVLLLRKLNRDAAAQVESDAILQSDPLDVWARIQQGDASKLEAHLCLDVALDYARAGFYCEAIDLLQACSPAPRSGTNPLIGYYLGWLWMKLNHPKRANKYFRRGSAASSDYCFPSRLEEIAILEVAMQENPLDARAPYYLGNLLYDRRRHEDAITAWEKSSKLDPQFSIVWRNLGIGYFNIRKQPKKAQRAYEMAFKVNPKDARLLYERDQLWKRLGILPKKRLHELEKYPKEIALRDDLTIELCTLYNQLGQSGKALQLISSRRFQPWEGGEGLALEQYVRTHLLLGRSLLASDQAENAYRHFQAALDVPENLAEARHLLANASNIWFWLGQASFALERHEEAKQWWKKAAEFKGDFQQMRVHSYSEMTFFSILSLERLGRKATAQKLARGLLDYAKQLAKADAKIDYFATSLPTMLLFDEDLTKRQKLTAKFLQAQALHCLNRDVLAKRLIADVLTSNPSHVAADFLFFLA